jgi:hypothetical protein
VRAYDPQHVDFRDFVLGRIEAVELAGTAKVGVGQDKEWSRFVTLVLRPRRGLSEIRRRALVRDHNMQKGRIVLKVRRPLAFYVLNHYGLLPGSESPHLELVSPSARALDFKLPADRT